MFSTRILVVEDNAVNQKVAEFMLKRLGYGSEIAANGQIALDLLEKEKFPVVLMDAQMPVMDGPTATKKIRSDIPLSDQPKIIVMTASLLEEAKDAWKSIEVDGFVEKPVRVDVLKKTLSEAFDSIGEFAAASS